jgi:hypothetical protein
VARGGSIAPGISMDPSRQERGIRDSGRRDRPELMSCVSGEFGHNLCGWKGGPLPFTTFGMLR